MFNRVIVIAEDPTGRNTLYFDTLTGQELSREMFVHLIRLGRYPNYHVRWINNIETPCSNPDFSLSNNLG